MDSVVWIWLDVEGLALQNENKRVEVLTGFLFDEQSGSSYYVKPCSAGCPGSLFYNATTAVGYQCSGSERLVSLY
jgi:hypothetical protein